MYVLCKSQQFVRFIKHAGMVKRLSAKIPTANLSATIAICRNEAKHLIKLFSHLVDLPFWLSRIKYCAEIPTVILVVGLRYRWATKNLRLSTNISETIQNTHTVAVEH